MKIGVFPGDFGGCALYRLRQPAMHCGLDDIDVREHLPITRGVHADRSMSVQGVAPLDVDVAVIQRPTHRLLSQAVPYIRAQNIAVVVDLDDDLAAVDQGHGGRGEYTAKATRDAINAALREADLVTVSTPRLAQRYRHIGTKVIVLPNYIDAAWLERPPPDPTDGITVGWSGNVGTHPLDLPVTGGAVGDALRATGAVFKAVGRPEMVTEFLDLPDGAMSCTGWVDLADYPDQVAGLHVGIAPLADTPFNRAKSWLKPLEYAALGVVPVCSPLPEYARLGLGAFAATPADWRRSLIKLIDDDDHRAALRDQAREIIAASYTIQDHAWRWAEAWEYARMVRDTAGRRRIAAKVHPLTGQPL